MIKQTFTKLQQFFTTFNIYKYKSLIFASKNGYTEDVKKILIHGTDPNIKDENGNTSLIYACSNGYLEIARLLLYKGANPNIMNNNGNYALNYAVGKGYVQIVELLLWYNANINIVNKNGVDILTIAIANILSEYEINFDIEYKFNTQIILESYTRYIRIVDLLINYGAYNYIKNNTNKIALLDSCYNKYAEIIKKLSQQNKSFFL